MIIWYKIIDKHETTLSMNHYFETVINNLRTDFLKIESFYFHDKIIFFDVLNIHAKCQ